MNNYQVIEDYYRAHRGELIAFVSARLHDLAEAEDIVQETFLRLLTGDRLISEVTLPNLTYTLCRNMVADWYRRHSVRLDAKHELTRSAGNGDSAETLLSMHEMTHHLEHGMARLSEDCRELYRMHIYGEMPVRDICRQTGQPYKSVEYRLGLARKQVRNYLRHVI